MKKLLMLGVMALVFGAGVANAEDGGDVANKRKAMAEKMAEKLFKHHDIDGNGVISKDEFIKSAEDRFDKIDADNNGEITKEEAKSYRSKEREKWREMMEKRKEGFGKRGQPDTGE